MLTNTKHLRVIKSFIRREGRLTKSQAHALEHYWPKYGLEMSGQILDFDFIFNRRAPRILEIGFGMGLSLCEMAQQHPQQDYIGIEVHRPGVGSLLAALEKNALNNVRVFCADAVEVLKQCIADNSLNGVQIFFPDPWHKKRHHKRRLIQVEFVQLLAKKLKHGGFLHMATDWGHYAQHMLEVMQQVPDFINEAGEQQFIERPASRPLTKFEKRGHRLGHEVFDLLYKKIPV